jgi:hypothetical protein
MRVAQFFAIVLTGLALVPAGAHLFSLPNKIDMSREAYFIAQQVYAGWALFGVVLIGALAANLVLAILLRRQLGACLLAFLGFLAIAGTLVVFFMFTFPTNEATANWTTQPENWEALRRQWEYSHAVNALITFTGFCAVVLAAVLARD